MTSNKQIFVSGRVQGVFFRDSTRQVASELNLAGGVRNLRDGRVEVQVSGEEKQVEKLINWLKTGPKLAKVTTIEVIDLDENALARLPAGRFEIWSTR